jgi:hypothetical protein
MAGDGRKRWIERLRTERWMDGMKNEHVDVSLTLGFWTLSIVRNSITRKHNVSETGSVSVLR